MSNTTVVPHIAGILRSSPFQQGAARYSQTRTALKQVGTFQKYSTGTEPSRGPVTLNSINDRPEQAGRLQLLPQNGN